MPDRDRILAVAATVALLVTPIAAATHDQLRQKERYTMGGDFLVSCNPQGLPVNVGGVCFQLTGRETQIGIHVQDEAHREADDVQQLADQLAGTGHPYDAGMVNGFWEIRDAGDDVLQSGVFCTDDFNVNVPTGAAEVLVFLNGPILGNPLLTAEINDRTEECPNLYHGAVRGTVFMTVQEDP